MSGGRDDIRAFIRQKGGTVLVEITEVLGSAPREAGAWMLVSRTGIFRTIGGGQLEYMAMDQARRILSGATPELMDITLGPDISQCCGGRVKLDFQRVDEALASRLISTLDAEYQQRPHVYIFGAGHVGNALSQSLSLTPVHVTLVDTREDELAHMHAQGVQACLTAIPEQVVRDAPAGSAFIILTHDHALDFLIVSEALSRGDAAYVGMIGSKTKRATFKSWLRRETGSDTLFDDLICPIGSPTVKDKRPEIIAALVTAEVLAALLTKTKVEELA